MGAEDARTSWRARAEVELGGAPLRTLVRRRPDALEIEPIEFADAGREEGLPSRPMCRSIALVVEERALDAARPLLDAVDVLWLRGSREAISTTPVVLEPTGDHVDRASITSALYLSDAGTERLLGRPPRPWDPRDAIGAAVLHDGGGGPVTQIAIVIALMLERRGVLGTARPPAVAVALSPEIFVEISKLRALRRLIDRVLTTLGEPAAVPLYVRTDERSLSRLDAPNNAVRGALGVSAAMLGGADCVGAVAMDAAEAAPSSSSARLARNTSLVLALESSLASTDDPARGSYFVEALTDRMARQAWELVREIERRGGLAVATEWVRERLELETAARRAALRTRALPLVGASRFAVATEHLHARPTRPHDASEFEDLHLAPPASVSLVVLGARADVEARAAFARELLEVGGMQIVDADDAGATPRVALVAAPDALFETEVCARTLDLQARGVAVWIAGRPGPHEAALRAAGARGFVHVGADVVDALTAMRALAGSSS